MQFTVSGAGALESARIQRTNYYPFSRLSVSGHRMLIGEGPLSNSHGIHTQVNCRSRTCTQMLPFRMKTTREPDPRPSVFLGQGQREGDMLECENGITCKAPSSKPNHRTAKAAGGVFRQPCFELFSQRKARIHQDRGNHPALRSVSDSLLSPLPPGARVGRNWAPRPVVHFVLLT